MGSTPTPESSPVDPQVFAAYEQGLEALRKKRASFALIGGLALSGYGSERRTKDVDFLFFCSARTWNNLVHTDRLGALTRDKDWHQLHPGAAEVVVRFRSGDVPVDILRPRDAHEAGLRGRRHRGRVGRRFCPLLAPEDYVLLKVKAQRDHDMADAIRVIQAHLDRLDYSYLRSWSIKLGLFEEVQYVVSQAERTPSG